MKKTVLLLLCFSNGLLACSDNRSGGEEIISTTQATPVRAVWIPDPSHTSCMHTYHNLLNLVDLLDELRINTLFLCSWARTQTIYKSQALTSHSTYNTPDEGYLFKDYLAAYNTPTTSPTGDPVKDLIREAHRKNIKVIFWFEYGFMASNGVTPASHPLLAENPGWMSKNAAGNQANYNGTDYYLNAYHPSVQEFMLKLIEESIALYPEIDGIQGDDRMPAMPRNSGYDDYTVNRYKAEHGGMSPSTDFNNAEWVGWRLDILNAFAKAFYVKVKSQKPDALVCFSPNPYPWCEDNLMQEWPQWIESGLVDLLSVQCYRNTIEAYQSTLQAAQSYVKAKTLKNLLNPGIILKNGHTITSPDLLRAQLKANQEIHTNGEAFFFVDGLYDPQVQEVLKSFYP
ncbi:MAG: family 10 glycosylhydrolase [Dysgonamonadaceae bacterium]|jgi:uncharacterized lipoprotein YddW (UPF0748 family)|nr:family 10 glycosylhydrolase [Dysgonamonadaceae bacterium]